MSIVTCDLAVSADGFVAGPRQSLEHPLGEGGMKVHTWHMPGGTGTPRDLEIAGDWMKVGAHVMGRNMFDHHRGDWDPDWRGWWGEEPPYGVPVLVLTHHPRDPLPVGRTTFHFVTDGIEAAVARAKELAGDENVAIAGGASTANQALRAGLVDQLTVHVAPVVLGAGERLFDGVPPMDLDLVWVEASPVVTHVRYAVRR